MPGKNRAEACLAKLQELNSSVSETWPHAGTGGCWRGCFLGGGCLTPTFALCMSLAFALVRHVNALAKSEGTPQERQGRPCASHTQSCHLSQVAVKVKTEKLTPESLSGFSMVVMVDAALEDCIE